jgi:hypothetical protein
MSLRAIAPPALCAAAPPALRMVNPSPYTSSPHRPCTSLPFRAAAPLAYTPGPTPHRPYASSPLCATALPALRVVAPMCHHLAGSPPLCHRPAGAAPLCHRPCVPVPMTSGRKEKGATEEIREMKGAHGLVSTLCSRKEVKYIQCFEEEITGRRASQMGLKKTKMHCIEISDLKEEIGDMPV